jgi:hypothetical protein
LKSFLKKTLSIIGTSVLISSCSHTVVKPVAAPPPLPARPVLESIVVDRNDKTGELGAWLSFGDLRKLTVYAEQVELVREKWGKGP